MPPLRVFIAFFAAVLTTLFHPAIAHTQDLYWINGTDMGPRFNHVQVWGPVEAILDATVTVNGTELSNGGTSGTYSGELLETLSPGDTLTLVVEIGDSTITGVDVVPEPPVVTGPTDGAEFGPLDTISVTWTSSTDPEIFRITVEYSGTGKRWEVASNQRAFDIPIGELPVNEPMVINVFAYNYGEFSGPYDPDSKMNIRGSIFTFPTVTIIDLTRVQPATWGSLKDRYE